MSNSKMQIDATIKITKILSESDGDWQESYDKEKDIFYFSLTNSARQISSVMKIEDILIESKLYYSIAYDPSKNTYFIKLTNNKLEN